MERSHESRQLESGRNLSPRSNSPGLDHTLFYDHDGYRTILGYLSLDYVVQIVGT